MADFLDNRRSIFAAPALVSSNRPRLRAEPSRGLHLVGTRARSLLSPAPPMGGGVFALLVNLLTTGSGAGAVAMTIADTQPLQPFSLTPSALTTASGAGTVAATIGS